MRHLELEESWVVKRAELFIESLAEEFVMHFDLTNAEADDAFDQIEDQLGGPSFAQGLLVSLPERSDRPPFPSPGTDKERDDG